MATALDKVMDQAAQAASNFSPPATVQQGGLPQTSSGGGAMAKPSLAAFVEAGGITVEEYLTVKEGGFRLGDMKGYFHEFTAILDMSDVIPIYSARGEAGGNTKFLKSYDGVSTPQGQNFAQAVAHLEATTKCTGIYSTVEIPVEVDEDIKGAGDAGKAGTSVGITPSLTGFKEFQTFVRDLTKAGLAESKLRVKIAHKERSNRNNNTWGVATFELLDVVDG